MKISALSQISSTKKLLAHSNPIVQNYSDVQSPQITNGQVTKELPSFHTIGLSIAFAGNNDQKEDGVNVVNVKAKIEETKQKIAVLKAETDIERSPLVQEAYNKIRNYDNWQAIKDSVYTDAKVAAEKERKAKRRFYGSYGVNAYNAKMEEMYYSKDRANSLFPSDVQKYREIIALYEKNVNTDEESRLKQIKILEEKLAELIANLDYAQLYDEINAITNSNGGVENRIAGYRDVKDEITRSFVNPIIASKNDATVHVPPAVMLYGALGCGKTTFLNAIQEQTQNYAVVVDLSNELDANESAFKRRINYYLDEAKKRYNETGKRTIYLINEAEQFFCITPEDIKNSGMLYNASDIGKIEAYNEGTNPVANVTYFKSLFDTISKIPTDKDPRGAATSFFITTNYPHLIHRDLLIRDGKFGKLMKIGIRPAANEDLKEVMRFYLKKCSDLVETIKMFSQKDNYADLVKSIPYITNKGKDILIEKIKNGTIVNMHVDPTGGEFRNFEQFIKGNSPSYARGAYSNARIQNIADKALAEYLENPAVPFETHFCNVKNRCGVDLTSADYRYFETIHEMVENPEKFQNSYTTIEESVQDMVQAYVDGQLSDEEIKTFKYQIKDIKSRYEDLKNKSDKTELELDVMQQYQRFLDAIEDLDLS